MKINLDGFTSDNDTQEAHYEYIVFQIDSILESAD
jgi:hypothetical protein